MEFFFLNGIFFVLQFAIFFFHLETTTLPGENKKNSKDSLVKTVDLSLCNFLHLLFIILHTVGVCLYFTSE